MQHKLVFSAFLSIAAFSEIQGSDRNNAMPRPNILWITIEDTSPQFIGCYGNEDARTPIIDGLSEEGIRITNAFSTGTVCSPSRTALITGVKTYMTGTGNHRSKYLYRISSKAFRIIFRRRAIIPATIQKLIIM